MTRCQFPGTEVKRLCSCITDAEHCQLLLVGCKFRFQMIFHRKVKFLWFQCCLHASETCFNVQPSSSSSQSSESVTCPLERHTAPVLSWCTRVNIATEVSLLQFFLPQLFFYIWFQSWFSVFLVSYSFSQFSKTAVVFIIYCLSLCEEAPACARIPF